MKKAVLLGTKHPIQRGYEKKDCFTFHIEKLCKAYNICAIAEEIDDKSISIAQNISNQLKINYEIIEPTQAEIKKLKIEEVHHIQYEFMNTYEIQNWDDEYNNLSPSTQKEYYNRVQHTYRQREAEWLKRINKLNIWPVLIICGAEHYKPFYKLLISSDIDVVKEQERWGV